MKIYQKIQKLNPHITIPLLLASLLFVISSCSSAAAVVDVVTPSTGVTVLDCPTSFAREIVGKGTTSPVTWTPPTATDSDGLSLTGAVTYSPQADYTNGGDFPIGDTTVSYTFTDDASPSNTETCTFRITISGLMKTYEFYLANDALDPAATNPFLIETSAELASLASVVNDETSYTPVGGTASLYAAAAYRLENSLDLSTGYTHTPIGDCKTATNSSSNPCGTSDDLAFTGTFDGNSNTLSNLSYSNEHKGLGLFSVISGATISNLTLMDPAMSNTTTNTNHSTGALVGTSAGTSVISNVSVIGGTIQGRRFVGGLVGHQSSGSITASSATGAVSGSGDNVGGLVGRQADGTITASSASGAVVGSGDSVGGLVGISSGSITASSASGAVVGSGDYVGGLVGLQTDGSITASSASGAVSGSGDNVGGLVGISSDTITASSASGAVSGSSQVGGLVGFQGSGTITASSASGAVEGTSDVGGLLGYQAGGTITASYATGTVSGTGTSVYVGGLLGFQAGGTITASYWDKTTTMQATSNGTGATGYPTAQLQVLGGTGSIYETWTTPPWVFMAGAYPTLSP